jgi:uncharacterized damage-inducible protein DinB
MTDAVRLLAAFAYNNAWANYRVLTACGRLSAAEFAAPRTGFFPSLRATLNHIVTVDHFYVDALERALRGAPPDPQPGHFFDPAEPFADCPALAAAQHAVDRRLLALCQGLTLAQLDGPVQITRRDGIHTDSIARILMHLFQHQIHHRGQAHAMLAGTTIEPPQLDEFFCANEAPLRAADFAALGFTEETVWGRT